MVIPAHPLALTAERKLDERRQRALTRYYIDAGAGGIAVAVHTTQFAIRDPRIGLLRPVLELAMEEARHAPIQKIAGVCGQRGQAMAEAELAASLGYDAALLSLGALRDATVAELLDHSRAVAAVIPVIGFYLQPSVGGRVLPYEFWRQFAEIDKVIAIKMAPFNRYQTLDVVRAVVESGRAESVRAESGSIESGRVESGRAESGSIESGRVESGRVGSGRVESGSIESGRAESGRVESGSIESGRVGSGRADPIALYTGNDDNILIDLLTTFDFGGKRVQMSGGLLGHWAMWTRLAVQQFERVKQVRSSGGPIPADLLTLAQQITDANAAIFDPAHGFHGCIPGIHEVLRRQGLLAGRWCLDPNEELSPGQMEEIDRIYRIYPHLCEEARSPLGT